MTRVELEPWEQELLESVSPADEDRGERCGRCWKFAPVRRWPLADRGRWPFDSRLPMLCQRCWLRRVRGDEPDVRLLDGELVVFTDHPQRGAQLRGSVRAVGIEPAELQPAIRWQLTGPRQDRDLGEFVGDFMDAAEVLYAATPQADELDASEGAS